MCGADSRGVAPGSVVRSAAAVPVSVVGPWQSSLLDLAGGPDVFELCGDTLPGEFAGLVS